MRNANKNFVAFRRLIHLPDSWRHTAVVVWNQHQTNIYRKINGRTFLSVFDARHFFLLRCVWNAINQKSIQANWKSLHILQHQLHHTPNFRFTSPRVRNTELCGRKQHTEVSKSKTTRLNSPTCEPLELIFYNLEV